MGKPDVDELAIERVKELKLALIQLQEFTVIGSGPINSSMVILPRQKGFVQGGPQVYIPALTLIVTAIDFILIQLPIYHFDFVIIAGIILIIVGVAIR